MLIFIIRRKRNGKEHSARENQVRYILCTGCCEIIALSYGKPHAEKKLSWVSSVRSFVLSFVHSFIRSKITKLQLHVKFMRSHAILEHVVRNFCKGRMIKINLSCHEKTADILYILPTRHYTMIRL